MMSWKSFKGANVFMSRNLVPPELFDSLHDALKQNGAEVFLCCDPSRTAQNDYHIISSSDHEKYDDLRAKGCNLLGPHCVLFCAKEHRPLPMQGFTCCLAMDGVKILASGFNKDEKIKIENLVTAMGGVLQTKASSDVNFVVVKNVVSAKYKWALANKKPIVTISWLHQCWTEHRVVPQESYRVPPFFGLTISVSRIPADERKQMEKVITENGGKYSAELTKKCTHLICDAPEGDKYKVAERWGIVQIVTRRWFDQSIARRACLNEASYPVQRGLVSSINAVRSQVKSQHTQDKSIIGNSQSGPSSVAPDTEATLSQNMSSTNSDTTPFANENPKDDVNLDKCVADDSQMEDSDLYLSDCRISLVGFESSEMRKLVSMVRRGGATRHMSLSDRLTHIVVGNPAEVEKKEVRSLAAFGVIHVVRTIWLEDCDREKKEIPVLPRHLASDLLLPKDSLYSNKGAAMGGTNASKFPMENNREQRSAANVNKGNSFEGTVKLDRRLFPSINDDNYTKKLDDKSQSIIQQNCVKENIQIKSTGLFVGKLFRFSNTFPEDRRAEIIGWIDQGGGEVVDYIVDQNVDFTIECHGVIPTADMSQSTNVSSHWIRSCLEDGCLLDVKSHILYSPLPCQIPLPGFETFRFCVSQYEERDRMLLRNLCFVLGAKFVEKLTRKVTHLLCKFTSGPKYEAACQWGIRSVTSEWISECVRQNQIVALAPFSPKAVTPQDRDAGLCTMSQYPTQAVRMLSGENPTQSQHPIDIPTQVTDFRTRHITSKGSSSNRKRTRLLEDSNVVPDVATAIEDLLEQTSKLVSSDCSILGQNHSKSQSAFGLSENWLNRPEEKDDIGNPLGDANGRIYDGFSETQTESQVVGYEEDLSGRQMLIDRVRTRSSMS